jgi:hypothetical protein
MASFEYTEIKDITALKDHVIVRDMNFAGRKLSSGILLLSDDLKTSGIRPRWAQVYRVGPEQTDVAPDQWVLIEHGRWTRGAKISIEGEEITIRRVDPENIIFVSDKEPTADDSLSTAVAAQAKTRD